jgi:predicted dehydrogenase
LLENRDDIRLIPEWGGGSLWDVGVYPLSLAQFFFGAPPVSVFGMQWLGDTGVDETFVGELRYHGDRFAQISSAFRTEYYIGFEIVGTLGRLTISQPFKEIDRTRPMIFHPNNSKPVKIQVPEQELYIGEVEDMNNAILHKSPTLVTLAETRDHVRTVLALYQSAQTGQPVQLSTIP